MHEQHLSPHPKTFVVISNVVMQVDQKDIASPSVTTEKDVLVMRLGIVDVLLW